MRWRAGFHLVVLLLVPFGPLASQRRPAQPADSVARGFFDAVARERWATAATFMDLELFRPFVSQALDLAREYRAPRVPTLEELMRNDPDMPREVAEYELRKYREYATGLPNPLPLQFAGVTSADSLAALSLEQAAAAWLEAQDDRTRIRELLSRNRCPVPPRDSLAQAERHSVIGVLSAGDTAAYALHASGRLRQGPVPDSGQLVPLPQVLELRRRGDTWRVVPRDDLLRPADRLLADVTCERPPARRIRP